MPALFEYQSFAYPSWWNGDYASSGSEKSLDNLVATGANSVSIIPHKYVTTGSSADFHATEETESLANVANAIADAHARGLKVLLKPHVDSLDGTFRGEFTPTSPDQWFANYKTMIVEYAKLAQSSKAEMFSIGVEYQSLTVAKYLPYWNDIITAVKQVYSGPLTYASNWDEMKDVPFWDKMDVMGVDAYAPLTTTNTPTVQNIIDGWTKLSADSYTRDICENKSIVDFYHDMSVRFGKPVLLTETGYRSVDGAGKAPYLWEKNFVQDSQEQADLYTAFFKVWSSYGGDWLKGANLWYWDTNPTPNSPTDYTPQGKPALKVITDWYSGLVTGSGRVVEGTTGVDTLDGSIYADTMRGNAGNDWLRASGGADILDGGAGNDRLHGGLGADTFIIAKGSGSDTILDFAAGIGTTGDLARLDGYGFADFAAVKAAMTTTSAGTVLALGNGETLTFQGVAVSSFAADDFGFGIGTTPKPVAFTLPASGAPTNVIEGTSAADILTGTAANDQINGRGNADTMTGGLGADTYVVNLAADKVVEASGAGIDTVRAAVSYTLPAYTENLTLTGSNAVNGTGSSYHNILTGNAAANALNGLSGNDILIGGQGADILTGGSGNDMLVYRATAEKGDVVKDFTIGQDLVDLRPLMKAIGYGGTDPLAAGIVTFVLSGADTVVKVVAAGVQHSMVTLEGVHVTDPWIALA